MLSTQHPIYLHQLFCQPSQTHILQTDSISLENKGVLFIRRGQLNQMIVEAEGLKTFINGKPVKSDYFGEGDWITVEDSHFIASYDVDHHRVCTPLNSLNPQWIRQLKSLPFIAQSDQTVLILGESGTGKEVLFQAIKKYSPRYDAPHLAINCGALQKSLVESELFGHKKGAFTGALQDRKGAFEAVKNGTLFLDEIGDLPIDLQPSLLRALENKQIRPVGADYTLSTNARVIAATHPSLIAKISNQQFRNDLYFRLSIVKIKPPPLRDRMEDLGALLSYFCKTEGISFNHGAIQLLKKHTWPGNIRELKNSILRAKALFPGQQIHEQLIPEIIDTPIASFNQNTEPLAMASTKIASPALEDLTKGLIISKLVEHAGNQRRAAKSLGMPKSTLHDKIKKYEINIEKILDIAD